MSRLLNKKSEQMIRIGVYHLAQIANWSEEEAAWVDETLGLNDRVEREGWVEQARSYCIGFTQGG